MFSWMVCFTSFQSMPQVMVCIVGMKVNERVLSLFWLWFVVYEGKIKLHRFYVVIFCVK